MNHAFGHDPRRQAVLLDLDGTLVASRDAIVDCLRLALNDLGHAPDPDASMEWVIGPPLHDIVARLLPGQDDEQIQLAIRRYRTRYEAGPMFESPLFPGIETAVRTLFEAGRRLFLATSKPLHIARRIIDAHRLTGLFEGLYGANPDDSGAEKPELIARLVDTERLDATRAVMVGDRRYDIAGAHANGVRALGVLWGYGGREELERAGADGLVDTPDRLVEAIEGMLSAVR